VRDFPSLGELDGNLTLKEVSSRSLCIGVLVKIAIKDKDRNHLDKIVALKVGNLFI
jgi:hypothetical protein